jgi:hypothetical protein
MKTEIKGDQIVKTLQCIFCILLLQSILTGGLQAQGADTTGIDSNSGNAVLSKSFLVAGGKDTLWLSSAPTLGELTRVFAAPLKGGLDPFIALQAVIGKGEDAVAALDSLFWSDPVAELITTKGGPGSRRSGELEQRSDTVRPSKLYAVMALEAIGSKGSYPVLFRLAQQHPNSDVRGLALNALATTFHEGDRLQNFVPDKELVHLLISCVDDTATVPYLAKSFGEIARQGLISWLGQDFGEPQGTTKRLRDAKEGEGETLAEYREAWWRSNASKVAWNRETGKFTIR